ncbi:MAG TPA: hypothetical protein VN025_01235 [Candidatus Dormibacteraeota bacterium]|nr:hypothetical protein [Candidatus Dormibacteraeota bacterium]
MKRWKTAAILMSALLLCAVLAPSAKADDWNHKTVVTFGDSVEVPGQVLLPGTYVFKLAESQANRHIVQIWTGDEQELITTLLTIPSQRSRPAGHTVFTFDERPADSPQALSEWFYPGETTGEEFVYSYDNYNNYSYGGSR